MILADTSVAVAHERSSSPRLFQIIQANQAAVCGITVAEMLAGSAARPMRSAAWRRSPSSNA